MPTTLISFLDTLRNSQVIPDKELDAILNKLSSDGKEPIVGAVAQELVEGKWITNYQAKELCNGSTISLGDYLILDPLGEGGMGKVYRARHQKMDRIVALKVIRDRHLDSETAVKRFEREITSVSKLSHRNIVTAYDAGVRDGRHYLAMELVKGLTLSGIVRAQGPLCVERAAGYIAQTATGLAYVHSHKIVHRDIKPNNIAVDQDDVVKVLDLGVARLLTDKLFEEDPMTVAGEIMGTFDFMAPEQATDAKSVDHRADIYSLGCTLYFLITGKSIYGAGSAFEKARAHREDPIPSLLDRREDLPTEIDAVFRRMVAKRPEDRFQSMHEVINALRPFVLSQGLTTSLIAETCVYEPVDVDCDTMPEQMSAKKVDRQDRFRKPLIVGGVCAAILFIGLAFVATRSNDTANATSNSLLSSGPIADPTGDVVDHADVNPNNEVLNVDEPVMDQPPIDDTSVENDPVFEEISVEPSEILSFAILKKVEATGEQDRFVATVRDIGRSLSAETHDLKSDLKELRRYFESLSEESRVDILRLDLGDASILGDDLRQLSGLTQLTWLSLYGCKNVSDTALSHLENLISLEYIDLRGTAISHHAIEHLPQCPLVTMQVDGRLGISGNFVQPLVEKYKASLQRLSLQAVPVTQSDMTQIAQFAKLTSLDISSTRTTDRLLAHLQPLADLEELVLAGNQGITDESLGILYGFSQLKVLDLTGTSAKNREKFESMLDCDIRWE